MKGLQTRLGSSFTSSVALGKQLLSTPVSSAVRWERDSLLTGGIGGVELGDCHGAHRHIPDVA